ncbi:MAG: response regulator, partial [Rhodoferax sp.]|nr:response regulator [Rhodoferax sp.]
ELERLRIAALLHDIGKIGTYDGLLEKPGKLTAAEYETIKQHPAKGAEMLAPIRQLYDIIPWVRGHHERYDGAGYPDGLKGENIPLQARILAVADTFDAMTAERPYRATPGKAQALEEIRRYAGTQFDPKVVEAFLRAAPLAAPTPDGKNLVTEAVSVERVALVAAKDIRTVENRETIALDGQALSLVWLSDVLEIPRARVTSEQYAVAAKRAILVAEDSITSRALIKNILESAGYNVTTAVDGVEAYIALKAGTFDLLVSDVEMPRMDGFDLTAKVRANKQLGDLPVVLVTALESREHRERGIDVGANAYIVKSSFDQSNLLEVVGRLI